MKPYEPTAAEIRAACLLIQSEWTPQQEMEHRPPIYRDHSPTFERLTDVHCLCPTDSIGPL